MNDYVFPETVLEFFEEIDLSGTPFDGAAITLGDRIEVLDAQGYQSVLGSTFRLELAVVEPFTLPIFSLPLSLAASATGEETVEAYFFVNESWELEIRGLPLALSIELPILKPVDTPDIHPFVQITGGLRITPSSISLLDEETCLSMARSEIVGLGIFVELHDIRLAFDEDSVPEIAFYYDLDESFRGLSAERATLEFLSMLPIGNRSGVRIDGVDLLIGSGGLYGEILIDVPPVLDVLTASEDHHWLGSLFDTQIPFVLWDVGLTLRASVPVAFHALGRLHLPILNRNLDLRFGLEDVFGDGDWRYVASLATTESVTVTTPAGDVTLASLSLTGVLEEDRIELVGALGGLEVDLSPFSFSLTSADVSFVFGDEDFSLRVGVVDVDLGPLGAVDQATLHLLKNKENGGLRTEIEAAFNWSDLRDRLRFNDLPDAFPLPPEDATVRVFLYYESGIWRFRFEVELSDVDALFSFIPEDFRPSVRRPSFVLDARYDDTGDKFEGSVTVSFELRLPSTIPSVPGIDLLTITAGDADGWIRAIARASVADGSDADPSATFEMTLQDLITVDVDLPGLAQSEPVIHTELTEAKIEFHDTTAGTGGGIHLTGRFELRPVMPSEMGLPIPPAMALQFEKLLRDVGFSGLSGTAKHSLVFLEDKAKIDFTCTFDDAGLEIDIFDLIADTAGGLAPFGGDNEIDLDIEVGFHLRRIALGLGSLDSSDVSEFSFAMGIGFDFGGLSAEISFLLTDDEFSLEIDELSIPIALPELPMRRSDLDALRDGSGNWDYTGKWLTQTKPALTTKIDDHNDRVRSARDRISNLEAEITATGSPDEKAQKRAELDRLRNRELPAEQKAAFHATAKKFMLESIFVIHNLMSEDANRSAFQSYVEIHQDILDNTLGLIRLDAGVSLIITNARLVLPFNNPSDIRVEGGARIAGFEDDHPLKPLEEMSLHMGISADAIYFAIDGGDAFSLPDIGPYTGGSVRLDQLRFGYGYSKNSLLIDFSGKLILPKQLVEDVDTSDVIGAGIRLPVESYVRFKINLIPIVLGEVDFLLPLFEFDIDLRRAGLPSIESARGCEPAWDGFQLIVPEVIRYGLKRVRFSPFFGPLPAPNYNLSYDFEIGNDTLGLTYVCDNFLMISPIIGSPPIPIPMLADGTSPFFDNLCTNIRIGGFQLNYNLQRPFPSVNPLALFELLGLIADPMMEINPNGHLASTIRASITNASIHLPPPVAGMFPEMGPIVNREINYTLNLGTVIALAQMGTGAVRGTIDATTTAAGDMAELVDEVTRNPPDLSPAAVLRGLPPELKRVELRGAFVGFDATAVFFLAAPDDAAEEFAKKADPTNASEIRLVLDETFNTRRRGWKSVDHRLTTRGNWRVKDGDLVQTKRAGLASRPYFGTLLYYERETFDDTLLSVSFTSNEGSVDVIFRYLDEQNYYRFRMTEEQGTWSLTRIVNGRMEELSTRQGSYTAGKELRVTVRAENRNYFRRPRFPIRLGRRPDLSPSHGVQIEIEVDGRLWDMVDDFQSPLERGHVGVGCWRNAGARFHSVRAYAADKADWVSSGVAADPTAFRSFQPNIPGDTTPVYDPAVAGKTLFSGVDILAGFDAADLLAVPTVGSDDAVVLVGARVRLLESQTYEFLGHMGTDGSFGLVSLVEVDPLSLRVAGIKFRLPLEVAARFILEGRSAGADSWSRVRAHVYALWDVLPSGLARLEIANEKEPAALTLASSGQFQIRGSGMLSLFHGQAVVEGSVDISHAHCFVNGHFQLAPDIVGLELFDLQFDCEGRMGPGPHFLLAGGGELTILGQSFFGVHGKIRENGGSVAARLSNKRDLWNIGGFTLPHAEMDLSGWVQFQSKAVVPDFRLEGAAAFGVSGAEIVGRGGIEAIGGNFCIFSEGALAWQGRNWLEGKVKLYLDSLQISGRTTFALDLTPQSVFGGTQLANLFLRVDIGGGFKIGADERLKRCDLELDWSLAIRLPGNESQTYTVAMQQLEIHRNSASADGTLGQLVRITKLIMLPFGDLSIPVPVIDAAGGTGYYLYFDWPFLQTTKRNRRDRPLFTIPDFDTKNETISSLLTNFDLQVYLAWKQGKLGVNVRENGATTFHSFDKMFE